jgi:hypothetical protein
MKRIVGIVLVAAATIAVTMVLNLSLIAGYPWSDMMPR